MLGVAYDKAEGKPRMTLDDMTIVVSAVVTLADDALVTFESCN